MTTTTRRTKRARQKRVIAKVQHLILARRNGKFVQEAYDAVTTICDEYGTDPDEAIEISTAWLRRNDLALGLNSV